MKHLFIIFLLIPLFAHSQQNDLHALVSQGGFDKSHNMSISWTLGEFFTETVIQGNKALTQGFQQPNIEITRLPSPDDKAIEASLFPNPTHGWLKIRMAEVTGRYRVEVIDLTGRVLSGSWHKNTEVILDVSEFPAGQYFIYIANQADEKSSTFSIVKF